MNWKGRGHKTLKCQQILVKNFRIKISRKYILGDFFLYSMSVNRQADMTMSIVGVFFSCLRPYVTELSVLHSTKFTPAITGFVVPGVA